MRAAVYRGIGRELSIEEIAEPQPGPDDVIIRVHRSGICGTDLKMTSDPFYDRLVGRVLGHEYAGEIAEVGSAVTKLRVGDRVTALPSRGCGNCAACRIGNIPLCQHIGGELGGFGEYLRAPSGMVVPLPATLSLGDGALIEPFAVSLWGARLAAIKPGDRVLVIGGGTVALTTMYWARHLGALRVVAVSRSQRREALALAMGADAFIQSGDDEIEEAAGVLGGAPDVVFECVGVPGVIERAIQHCAQLGQIVSLGYCTTQDTIVPSAASRKAVTLKFALGYSLNDFEYIADIMDKGHADPKILISSVVPLAELPAKLEELRGPNSETKVHVSVIES